MIEGICECPWDTAVFGIPCYEIEDASPATLDWASRHSGHYTIRVSPLSDKKILHDFGFYYADTLIVPECTPDRLRGTCEPYAKIKRGVRPEEVEHMCVGSFLYGRFHRDLYLSAEKADQRYIKWLHHLSSTGELLGLMYQEHLAGFVACKDSELVLHALAAEYRGKGLAKGLWHAACRHLFEKGATRLRSSISAANLPVLNLYASLGFRFSSATDIYHRLTKK
ncbi:GNAT family N-acetyltransferase [Candidatus Parcubacteria bacterium]|nr:MAG: GNAT family N-acetyltransferase [Candidatus Parcubacteria bacterium]